MQGGNTIVFKQHHISKDNLSDFSQQLIVQTMSYARELEELF